jgi:hypothetical protein
MMVRPAGLLLRLRLGLSRIGPLRAAICLLAAVAASTWYLSDQQRAVLRAQATAPDLGNSSPVAPAAPPAAQQNLTRFYEQLGDKRYAEQQIKTLFELADHNGLVLQQGEYKYSFDQAGRVDTCQILLPIKGSYDAVWRFALQVLQAVPFAALSDLRFRRDDIGDARPQAQMRLTLYFRHEGGRLP